MKTYTAYVRHGSLVRDLDVVLVKDGFRFWAALFGPIWALGLGLWLEALGLFGIVMMFDGALFLMNIQGAHALLAWIGYLAIFGYLASSLQRWALERRGYVFWDVVAATDDVSAARRLFDRDGAALQETQA